MKIAILNDTHAGARNSSEIFMEYQERFYSEVFFPYLKENGITRILHLGDYYEHRKFVNFKALHTNRRMFLDKLREYHMHMDIIPGNHDVFYKNTNELCALKELQGYYTDCVTIHMKPTVVTFDGLNIALVPWVNVENYARSVEFINKAEAPILGGHFELEGFEMHKGVVNTHGQDVGNLSRYEMVLSGHFHTKSSRGNVHYLGSQMEFNWSDCDDPKFFHVLDTETRELTAVRNPLTLFDKIVYDDTRAEYTSYDVSKHTSKFVKVVVVKKTDLYGFDRFIDRLQDVETHELKIAETFDEYMGENVEDEQVSVEDTTVMLDSYVDAVDTDLDKDRLKGYMRELYVEAQNTEIV
jgi:DNA repair exonuclease SbcCD nuclease subunit